MNARRLSGSDSTLPRLHVRADRALVSPMVAQKTQSRWTAWRLLVLTIILTTVVPASLFVVAEDGQATSPLSRVPFRSGTSWMISQGYNPSPAAAATVPAVTVSDTVGEVGEVFTVGGSGFTPGDTAEISWRSRTLLDLTVPASGSFSTPITIPQAPNGDWPIDVTTGSDRASVDFRVIPSLEREPARAAPGERVTITVNGFAPNETVRLTWRRSSGPELAQVMTNRNGTGEVTIALPDARPGWIDYTGVGQSSRLRAWGAIEVLSAGDASITANDESGASDATATFDVATTADPGATTMTGPGTYTVVATREGLVGYTTSNGHVIVPDDHFVSLPACTATSCPWLTPGQRDDRWGLRTECGDKCYVIVINETTGSCDVAPIWDTGPWFTVDDWWKPGPERHLNLLPSNPNYLAQGVTGAGAARNGLDVGYGIGPNDIGSSNRYATVGNASVIDLADGTWTAIGLDFNKGIDVIDVELLWQTGQSPASAAAECGHPLDQSGDTGDLELSATQGEVGTRVRVQGGGFSGGESVRLHVGSATLPAVVTVQASSGGMIDTTITIPDRARGNSDIIAIGANSGTRQESIFSVTPSIERVLTSGSPGTRVSITVHGYGANEDVRLWWDTRNGTSIATIRTTANGTGSTQFAVPSNRETGWNTYYARGVTSGAGAFGAFNITAGSATPSPTPTPSPIDVLIDRVIELLKEILAELAAASPMSMAAATQPADATPAAPEVTPAPVETSAVVPEASIDSVTDALTVEPGTGEADAEPIEETPTPTEAPVESLNPMPTEVPTGAPTQEAVLQTREIVIPVSSDLSVSALEPGATEDPAGFGALFLGGPDGEIAGMTFDIAGVDGGDITSATLVVQGAGDVSGEGGPIYVNSGVRVDNGSKWNSIQAQIGSSAGYLEWISPGAETSVDLTGWIPVEGPVTVILPETSDQRVMIASLESGTPAYLVLMIEELVLPGS